MTDAQDATGPRARGLRMARAERRSQLLAVALDLFSTEGFHHVSMDDIADRAEVSKPVLYRHFPSKLDLYLAVVDEQGEALLSAVERAVAPIEAGPIGRGEGRAVVAAVVHAYLAFVQVAGESSTLLFESDVTHDAQVRVRVEHAAAEATRRIADVLAAVTGRDRADADVLASALVATAQGAATYWLRRGDGQGVERVVELVTDLQWRGLAGLVRPDFPYGDA
ncbi:TetR/AcrR family transcriptional regulator [Cellulomonas xiejunii]|uniref:TetR/AcrR family transcriptional regulator n=1 Tax=Cellulomonas xiejunii TaxID=2968083 RepID=A0ABY5KJG2_9CELL|nr:TetR/AcrR family transcriptional regulator [Cellulomonas xiejunii]MCC2312809.1 TetR/AcrR family transcriptional regulator [Cellulomonas xiejunii]MCC2320319.1 TetR/AcrR family transcriptional regulator [Cellulomonas xiejunii]UUI70622.1 TetR/AcrR family transcriptional regulator [Cellulomonas xiejunii]